VIANSNRNALLTIVLVSYLMIVLDISIVITALPKIQQSFEFSPVGLSWVQNAYTLAFGGLLLFGARAGDVLGRRRMFITGLAIFTASSLVIGLAPTAVWILIARAVQGVSAAMLAPSTLALLATHFPEGPERTHALSLYAATAGIGASLGLVLGGLIAGWISWRVGFFINVPIGIALLIGARRVLVETPRHSGKFDIAGALSSTIGMFTLVYGIIHSASAGWNDAVTVACIAAAVVLLALFILIESRAEQPILPLRLFASRQRSGAYAARALYLGAMMSFWFFTTQFLQRVLGFTPLEAGAAFLPTTVVNFAAAFTVPRLTRRFGNGRVLAGALTLTLLGMAWLSQVSAATLYLTGVALPMMLIGAGQGVALGPFTIAGVAGVAPEDAGAASGLVNVAHQIGGTLGLSILVVVFATVGADSLGVREALSQRIDAAFTGGTVMLALALLLVLVCIVRPGKVTAARAPSH
jgi:EmrB/QacA subfamily drug resistance transporter